LSLLVRQLEWCVYDSARTGHHGEFLRHIAAHCADGPLHSAVGIACHPEIAQSIAECFPSLAVHSLDIRLCAEMERCRSAFRRGRLDFRLMLDAANRLNAPRILAMWLNPMQVHLALACHERTTFRGILLNHQRPSDRPQGLLKRLKQGRKRIMLSALARSSAVERIFLLNDEAAARDWNQTLGRDLCRGLFDPVNYEIPRTARAAGKSVSREFNILLFGSMEPRKGVLELLQALEHLGNLGESRPICLSIVGRFQSSSYRSLVEHVSKRINHSIRGVSVEIVDEHVAPGHAAEIFSRADCVAIAYIGFVGSSGVLGQAARFGKPAIASREGLIGRLVNEYGLGLLVDPTDPSAYAKGIAQLLRGDFYLDPQAADRYCQERSREAFCRELFAA
jgi:glycosyltransferase involved in cell wall biosynthesis